MEEEAAEADVKDMEAVAADADADGHNLNTVGCTATT